MSARWLRVGLAALAVPQLLIAIWALASPKGWYDSFPGAGHAWVSALGPYDEHLVRDVGAGYLAIGILLAWAAIVLGPSLVRAALGSFLVFLLPHLLYHLVTADHFGAVDNALSLGGFALEVALALVLLGGVWRTSRRHGEVAADPGSSNPRPEAPTSQMRG